MTQIGGAGSALFALSTALLARLDERVAEGTLAAPRSIHRQAASGGVVLFGSFDKAMLAKLAIV